MSKRQTNPAALKRLNRQQRKAVTYGVKNGKVTQHLPMLIVAGAGTGKTDVTAERIAFLVACGVNPDNILAIVFGRRAAKELVTRAQTAISAARPGAALKLRYAGTFHSIAYGLLIEFGSEFGLEEGFTILDRDDAADLMDRVRTRSGYGKKNAFPKKDVCCAIQSYITNACSSLKATMQQRHSTLIKYEKPLANVFADYTAAKRSQNAVDYDDLLKFFVKLLKHPKIGKLLRQRFKFVFVDEFQDTNRLQFKILKLLKPEGRGVTVVGDDAQAIYSFRAATVENIREFPKSFKSAAKIISLTRNYRSTSPILKASNAVMSLATDAFKKELWSKRKSAQRPYLTTVMDEGEQAKHVTETILDLRERGIALKDQAVLVRASQHSHFLEVELDRAKIPYKKWGGMKFLESAHIKDVMSILRWWQNPRDQIAGFRTLLLIEGIGKTTADRLAQDRSAGSSSKTLPSAEVPKGAIKHWKSFKRMMHKLSKSEWPGSIDVVLRWYRPQVPRLYNEKVESRLADLEQLPALGETFGSCRQFLAELALDPPGVLAEHRLAKDDTDDILTLSTIHSAKGREWKSVMILSVMDGCIPSARCKSKEEIEEERRLLYVAMTRSRDRLELILPRRSFQFISPKSPAGAVYSKPSRFLPAELHRLFKRKSLIAI